MTDSKENTDTLQVTGQTLPPIGQSDEPMSRNVIGISDTPTRKNTPGSQIVNVVASKNFSDDSREIKAIEQQEGVIKDYIGNSTEV